MKKITASIIVSLFLNLFSSLGFAASELGEAMKILPESTDFVIKFSSMKEMYDYLSVTDRSIWGHPIEDLNDIRDSVGFNPFDLKEIADNGFDSSKPVGVAISDFKIVDDSDNPHMNIVIFLPVTDVDKAVEAIKGYVEEDNPEANFRKNGNVWSWSFDTDSSEPEDLEDEPAEDGSKTGSDGSEAKSEDQTAQQSENSLVTCYMVNIKGYLFLGANPVVDANQFFAGLSGNSKKMSDSQVFKEVLEKSDASKEIFLYANLGRIFKSNPQAIRYLSPVISGMGTAGEGNASEPSVNSSDSPKLSYLKDYKGLGVAVDLKSPDLRVNFVLNLLENSTIMNLFRGSEPKRGIVTGLKDKPLLITGIMENFQVYWKMVQESLDKETLNTLKKEFADFKKEHTIDVEKDIIQNLGYNLSLGIFDAVSINLANVNSIASVEFKDPMKMKSVIEKMILKLTPQQQSMINKMVINGVETYMVPAGPVQLYGGFSGNDFVIAVGKNMFEKAISADPSSGFMMDIKERQLQRALSSDLSVFYCDIRESLLAVKNFIPVLAYTNPDSQIIGTPEFMEIMHPFEYILADSRMDGNAMTGDFIVKTGFNKPFLKGLKDTSVAIEALKKKVGTTQPSGSDSDVSGSDAAASGEGAAKE